jgi:2Fe-2S ferredoxin
MPKIIVLPHEKICPQGAELEIESGSNLCRSLLDHGIPIEHACDLSGACTTCHVVVKKGFDSLEEMDDVELTYWIVLGGLRLNQDYLVRLKSR